jgi:hypothetical protein
MNKMRLSLTLLPYFLIGFIEATTAQTVIYSESYPAGIVCDRFVAKFHSYTIYPLNNSNLEIVIPIQGKKSVVENGNTIRLKEINTQAEAIVAHRPELGRAELWGGRSLPIDSLSGEVYINGYLSFPDKTQEQLYLAFLSLPSGLTEYHLESEDSEGKCMQKYRARCFAKFGKRQFQVLFNLKVSFEDGGVKYEYSDFIAGYKEVRGSVGWYTFQNTVDFKTLGTMYGNVRDRNRHVRKFWLPILSRIDESLDLLRESGLREVSAVSDRRIDKNEITKSANPQSDKYAALEKLYKLLEMGAINQEEYEAEKKVILGTP